MLDLPVGPAAVAVLRGALEPYVPRAAGVDDAAAQIRARAPITPIAPIPVVSARISDEYRTRLIAAVRPDIACPDACDVILTTSGSTGEPKAVMHTWSAIEHSTHSLHERLGGAGAWVCALPLHTSAGFMTVARSVVAGTQAIAVESLGGATPFNAEVFAHAVAQLESGPIYTSLVPEMAQRLLGDASGIDALRRCDAVLIGGQAIPEPLVLALRSAGVNVVLSYGMTETCGGCVYDGQPLADVNVSISHRRVEICGPVVMLGYRGSEGVIDTTTQRCFLTSDVGHVTADGRLVIEGRTDDVVIVHGVNVSLSAVEAILRDLGINATACASDTTIYAATASGLSPDEHQAAIARVSTELAVRIDFRVVSEVPMTAAGKPDRIALATLLASNS